MLRAGLRRPRRAAAHRRRRRGDDRRGAARHRPGLRRRPAGAAPAPRPGAPRRPTWGGCSRARRSSPPTAGPDCHRVQDAYSLRCAPQVHGAARDTLAHADLVAARELASAVDNPVVLASTAGSSPTATSTAHRSATCSTSWRSPPPTSPRSASDAPTGCSTRPATTGCRRSSPTTPASTPGYMIAQYTQAGDRLGAEAARGAGHRRLHPVQRDAGGPRLDGLVGGRKLRRAVDGLTRVLAIEVLTAARALDLRAPLSPRPGHRRRRRAAARGRGRGPRPRPLPLPRDRGRRRPGRLRRRPVRRRAPDRSPRMSAANPRLPIHAATGTELTGPLLADRGAAADADEQPRPGRRRAPRGPRRLRRHRQGGAQPGRRTTPSCAPCATSATTRPCWCSRASRSACSAPTSGRRGC